MAFIDNIFDALADNEWHVIDELSEILDQPPEIIETVLNFCEEFNFIYFDETRSKISINPKIMLLS